MVLCVCVCVFVVVVTETVPFCFHLLSVLFANPRIEFPSESNSKTRVLLEWRIVYTHDTRHNIL